MIGHGRTPGLQYQRQLILSQRLNIVHQLFLAHSNGLRLLKLSEQVTKLIIHMVRLGPDPERRKTYQHLTGLAAC